LSEHEDRSEHEQSERGEVTREMTASPRVSGRILVVDDEQMVRSMLARMLGQEHQVVTAATGEAARDILEKDPSFDVILCDLMMPGMSGTDLHEWLATHRPALAERMVFVTGGVFTPQAFDYIARAGNARFEKPFQPSKLKAFISEIIAARHRDARP
jgi:CheY-like chemotaxis protein